MAKTQYKLIYNAAYVWSVHPGILHIPKNSTRVVADVLKRYFDKNICVFHEFRGVEQA